MLGPQTGRVRCALSSRILGPVCTCHLTQSISRLMTVRSHDPHRFTREQKRYMTQRTSLARVPKWNQALYVRTPCRLDHQPFGGGMERNTGARDWHNLRYHTSFATPPPSPVRTGYRQHFLLQRGISKTRGGGNILPDLTDLLLRNCFVVGRRFPGFRDRASGLKPL